MKGYLDSDHLMDGPRIRGKKEDGIVRKALDPDVIVTRKNHVRH